MAFHTTEFLLLIFVTHLCSGLTYAEGDVPDVTETSITPPVTERVSRLRLMWNYIIGLKDECVFTCENGAQPVPRPRYTPKTNGCGSYGISLAFMNDIPAVQGCCNRHDTCYQTCGEKHSVCDDTFRSCLYKYCHHAYDSDEVTDGNRDLRGCKRLAETAHATVQLFGCQAYQNNQKSSCVCPRLISWQSLTDWLKNAFGGDEDKK